MKKLIILVAVMCVLAGMAYAQEQTMEPKKEFISFDWPGAKCDPMNYIATSTGSRGIKITELQDIDALVCQTAYPLIVGNEESNDRLLTYGSLKVATDKAGNGRKEYDLSNDKYLTAAGRELYKSIKGITVGKLFAIYQCVIGYNTVSITTMNYVKWDDSLIGMIQDAFVKSDKIDKASQ